MRRRLGSLLLAILLGTALVACGNGGASTVSNSPAPTPSSTPTKAGSGDSVDFVLVKMITETEAGGTVSPTAVPLGDDTAVEEFVAQFETDGMRTRVLDAVQAAHAPDDRLLYGAVVAVGCDAPDRVTVTSAGSGLVITAQAVKSPQQECFAAQTTVALVLVPASAAS